MHKPSGGTTTHASISSSSRPSHQLIVARRAARCPVRRSSNPCAARTANPGAMEPTVAAVAAAGGWSSQTGAPTAAAAATRLHDAVNNNKEHHRNRNYLLQQDVQAVVSEKGKQKIQCLLDQVYGLLPIEQLLLYLKLPTEQSGGVDPLRQSMNPLGSRSEINQTIIWIQTHLEEDKELSLQKKGVYDDYVAFCEPNGIKPLSTADFGKVMKQVYPNVRPRRLGTRGQSKYCYSGLRSRIKLDSPMLPDLSDKTISTEAHCTQSDYMAAAWQIIKEWAEEKLSAQFQSAIALAYYLVKELSIAINTEAAQLVTDFTASSCSDNTHSCYINRHKETTMQLQRKLQQTKESKRKQMQNEKSEQKYRGKKLKGSPPSTSCSTSPIVPMEGAKEGPQTHEYLPNCDSANNSLPDFNSFHRAPPTAEPETPPATNKSNYIGKAAITRIAKQSNSKRHRSKYKDIQPKPDFGEIPAYDAKDTAAAPPLDGTFEAKRSRVRIKKEEAMAFLPNDASPYFSRERLESVSQVSKDALDEYLGTSNSQEPEEEIIKYLGNNDEDKLTQLRELLVQNCPPSSSSSSFSPAAKGGNQRNASKHMQNLNIKRRVSFETSAQEDYTSRRRNEVNFIPISSPNGGKQSMCSSANASPFVSPRNTPILRAAKQRGKPKRPNLELKLHREPVDYRNNMVNLPMSAPPSPKTYGYGKFYPNVAANFPPHATILEDGLPHNPFRSQSVPVPDQNQIYSAFPYPPTNMNTELNENIDVGEMIHEMDTLPGTMNLYDPSCRVRNPEEELKFPSRSVPNTPLPYHPSVDFQAYDKDNLNSKSYPTTPLASETFTYGQSHDYLLNGQPIKEKPMGYMTPDDGNSVYSTFADGDLIDAHKGVVNVNLEAGLPDCELINKSNIDDMFKVVPE